MTWRRRGPGRGLWCCAVVALAASRLAAGEAEAAMLGPGPGAAAEELKEEGAAAKAAYPELEGRCERLLDQVFVPLLLVAIVPSLLNVAAGAALGSLAARLRKMRGRNDAVYQEAMLLTRAVLLATLPRRTMEAIRKEIPEAPAALANRLSAARLRKARYQSHQPAFRAPPLPSSGTASLSA